MIRPTIHYNIINKPIWLLAQANLRLLQIGLGNAWITSISSTEGAPCLFLNFVSGMALRAGGIRDDIVCGRMSQDGE
jgi:hypothetical protein